MIRKLTTIIVVSFVLINATFLAGMSYVSYRYFFSLTSEEISEARLSLLNENTKKISSVITSIKETGNIVVANRDLHEMLSNTPASTFDYVIEQREIMSMLNNITSLKSDVYSIEFFTNRYQQAPLLQGGSIYPLEKLEDENWFEIFENMDDGWVPIHLSSTQNKEVLSHVRKLMNHRGEVIGFIKVNILNETLLSYIEDDDFIKSPEELLLLADTGGRIIAQTDPLYEHDVAKMITEKHLEEPYYVINDEFKSTNGSHTVITHNNEKFLLLISKPNYEQWSMIHVIPAASLYAKTQQLGLLILLMGISAMLLFVPIAYLIGNRINIPIKKIIKGMKSVEKGQYDTRLGPYYIEEYDILAKNFNEMNHTIEESLKKLNEESGYRKDAEIRALQSQIMPHFLYNTLDMIHWKAMDYQAEELSVTVNQLSKMLRISLSGGQTFIPLRNELEHSKCYLQIQCTRLKNPLDIEVNVPASFKNYYVPKVILQPFIENSIRHGYDIQPNVDIKINISASLVKDGHLEKLELMIKDHGKGLPSNWTIEQVGGIGIKNVMERIWLYCGKHYGVKISDNQNGGVVVKIHLPIIKNAQELEEWTNQNNTY
ncbi:histidine kinase [Bacillus sp. TS-2]|nr:histidine kinase [Bacillus sp. TS-2]